MESDGDEDTRADERPKGPDINACFKEAQIRSRQLLYRAHPQEIAATRPFSAHTPEQRATYCKILADNAASWYEQLYPPKTAADYATEALTTLFMAVPDFACATTEFQEALAKSRTVKPERKTYLHSRLSWFHSLIRHSATVLPEINALELIDHLQDIAALGFIDETFRNKYHQYLDEAVYNSQHQLAFGQVLTYTRSDIHPAPEPDAMHGIGYTVPRPSGADKPLRLSVRRSIISLGTGLGSARVYERMVFDVTDSGTTIIQSPVKDEELAGKFYLRPALAAAKAPRLDRLISHLLATTRPR